MRKAVLDVGSNSVLLLVAEWDGSHWIPRRDQSAVTALGLNTKATGLLGEIGMTHTLDAIRRFWDIGQADGCESIVAAATMAARIATNTPDFLARAEAQGTPVIVLSGDDEAELGFRAVADDATFDGCPRLTIIDVGGQSTEMATANRTETGWDVPFRKSYPIGTLGLESQLNLPECPTAADQLRASAFVDDLVGLAYRPGECGEVVALGATGTNLVTIREEMAEYDADKVHGQTLLYEEISRAASWLCGMPVADRAQIVGMEKGREKTLHLGALILERFLFAARAESCRVSARGWRHALLEQGLP